jgi:hypothetical protein
MPSNTTRRFALAAAVLAFAGCRNPQADALVAEQMRDIGDEVNNTRQETADLREAIDSLRIIVARQDTLLRQIASMAGVPVPPR